MTDADGPARASRGFWVALGPGAAIIAYGVRGALDDLPGVQLTSFLRWFVGLALVHDLLVGPVVITLGWILASRLPRHVVGPVQGALLASGLAGLVAWPFLRGYGITPGEPSFLSRDYTASLLVIWAAIWCGAAVLVAARSWRRRRAARRRDAPVPG